MQDWTSFQGQSYSCLEVEGNLYIDSTRQYPPAKTWSPVVVGGVIKRPIFFYTIASKLRSSNPLTWQGAIESTTGLLVRSRLGEQMKHLASSHCYASKQGGESLNKYDQKSLMMHRWILESILYFGFLLTAPCRDSSSECHWIWMSLWGGATPARSIFICNYLHTS